MGFVFPAANHSKETFDRTIEVRVYQLEPDPVAIRQVHVDGPDKSATPKHGEIDRSYGVARSLM